MTIRDREIDMAGNGNAKVPQLNRDVTGLAQTIHYWLECVSWSMTKRSKPSMRALTPAEPVHSIKASRNPAAN
jgi:hypothetical protein